MKTNVDKSIASDTNSCKTCQTGANKQTNNGRTHDGEIGNAKVQLLFDVSLIVDAAVLRFQAWDTAAAAALTTNRNSEQIAMQ